MENMNAEKNAGRKKLLVPLVVLIMCGVALTGAAYALATSVTVEDNPVNGDYYSIDMYNSTGTATIDEALTAGTDFQVYTTKTVGDDYYTVKVDQTTFTRSVYVKVSSDVAGSTYNLSVGTVTVEQTGDLELTIAHTGTVMKINGAVVSNPVAKDALVQIDLTFTVSAYTNNDTFATVAAINTAVNSARTFDLTITATLVEA